MSVAVVTGSAGLIGSEAARHFSRLGYEVWGIDNDSRKTFFGESASTDWMRRRLEDELSGYRHHDLDIRDGQNVDQLFRRGGKAITVVIHAAAQPSHDWAARDPLTDFSVNATGTLVLLEATRHHAPEAAFIFTSTNKVYGDSPNGLPFEETPTRYDLPTDHPFYEGIPETMSIDASTHSIFGVSKASSDLMVQEYGRYFGMPTVCFRAGCLTGPGHSGAELHGFLAYLMRCSVTGEKYTVFGYQGKQVRDNIHSADLISALESYIESPRPAAVYNIGGGRFANCSMLEAIELCNEVSGRELDWTYTDENRIGDHQWWISDTNRFTTDFPRWKPQHDIQAILRDIYEQNVDRWKE